MIEEIVFTSSKRGLETGKTGFCTVAATPNMSAKLLRFLEASSGYRHLNSPGHADNPVVHSHVKVVLGGQQQHVISRVGDAGLDYSNRSNKIAHHLAISDPASFDCGPVGLMWNDQNFVKEWDEEPRFLSPRVLKAEPGFPAPCSTWETVFGDAGRAGDLIDALLSKQTVYLVLEPTDPAIELIDEVTNVLPPNQRWDLTFSTFFTRTPPNVECQIRVVFPNSAELTTARRSPKNVIIDARDKQRSTSLLAAFTREGRSLGEGVRDQQVPVAAKEKSGSPSKRVVAVSQTQNAVTPPSDFAPPSLGSGLRPSVTESALTPWYTKPLAIGGLVMLLLAASGAVLLLATHKPRVSAEKSGPNATDQAPEDERFENRKKEKQFDNPHSGELEADSGSESIDDSVADVVPERAIERAIVFEADRQPDSSARTLSLEDTERTFAPGTENTNSNPDVDRKEELPNEPELVPDASCFKRFVLTKPWSQVLGKKIDVFQTSLAVEELKKCDLSLVRLDSEKAGLVKDVEIKLKSANNVWEFISLDFSDEKCGRLSIESRGEGRTVGTFTYLDDSGLPDLHEVTLRFDDVQIPLNLTPFKKDNGKGVPVKISPLHDGESKRPFREFECTKDTRIKIYDRQRYSIVGNDSRSAVFEIDFSELTLGEPKQLLEASLPTIKFKITVLDENIVKMASVVDFEEEKYFKDQPRIKAVVKVVKDNLKLEQEGLEERLKALENDLNEKEELTEAQKKEKKQDEKRTKKIAKQVKESLKQIVDGSAERALAKYFNEISIPVEMYDSHGRTQSVTVLYFDEGERSESETVVVEKLMLDVHETKVSRDDSEDN